MTYRVAQHRKTAAGVGGTLPGRGIFLVSIAMGVLLCPVQAHPADSTATAPRAGAGAESPKSASSKSATTKAAASAAKPSAAGKSSTSATGSPKTGSKVSGPSSAASAPVAVAAAPAMPQYAPFSEFLALKPGDLMSLRFKLTRLGGAEPGNAVAAWAVSGQVADPAEFAPYRRPGFQYEPQNSMPYIFTIEPDQLAIVVNSVGSLPQVARGVAESRGMLSFAMLATVGGRTRAFEAVLGIEQSRLLMQQLLGALATNVSAVNTLRRFGCAGDLLPDGAPATVDSLVTLTLTGLRPDKGSPGEYTGSVVITNISAGAIPAPLTLVVAMDSNTQLIGAEGQTCHVDPAGAPIVGLGAEGLEPGASLRQTLRFWNQTGERFGVSFKLVAGEGTR